MNALTIKRKALLYLVGTFLAGLIAGAVGGYHWPKGGHFKHHTPEQMAEGMEKVLKEKLDLSEEQAVKARPILLETARNIQLTFQSAGRTTDQYFQENNRKLSEFLTADQIQKLNELEENRKRMFNKNRSKENAPPARDGAGLNKPNCAG